MGCDCPICEDFTFASKMYEVEYQGVEEVQDNSADKQVAAEAGVDYKGNGENERLQEIKEGFVGLCTEFSFEKIQMSNTGNSILGTRKSSNQYPRVTASMNTVYIACSSISH